MNNQIEPVVYEGEVMPTATYVRTLTLKSGLGNERRVQELYKLSEPLKPYDYASERHCDNCGCNTQTYDLVVVSAVDNQFAFETYIFPSNKYGEIESYTNLPGSISAVFDIEAALRNAGYQVIRYGDR